MRVDRNAENESKLKHQSASLTSSILHSHLHLSFLFSTFLFSTFFPFDLSTAHRLKCLVSAEESSCFFYTVFIMNEKQFYGKKKKNRHLSSSNLSI